MTNPNNGATLEDCHSNFFALTDLCGIRWRRFVSESPVVGSAHGHHSYGPLDDPVLSSFAKCLAADVLCVWRRSPNSRNQQQQNQSTTPNDPFMPVTPTGVPSQFMQTGGPGSMQNPSNVQMHMQQQQTHQLPSHLMSPHGGMGLPPGHVNPHHGLNVPPPYPSGQSNPNSSSHLPHGHGMPQQPSAHNQQQQQPFINPSLNGPKELWIFWYGEEPDLSSLVSQQLLKADPDQGTWENGLSYECRTLLFKALHNLIERCLLSREFVRVDKWFIQPCDDNQRIGLKTFPMQLSFSFEFFVHGESTVCMSVDVRQHPAIRRIGRTHISVSQNQVIPVILAPYGLAGTLTGVGYRMSDPGTHKILEEWKQFYPVEAALKSPLYDTALPTPTHASPHPSNTSANSVTNPVQTPPNSATGIPPVVEVRVGGVIMRYPSCYVLCTELDDPHRDEGISSNCSLNNNKLSVAIPSAPRSRNTACVDSESAAYPSGPSPNKPQGAAYAKEIDKIEGVLPERVWQECMLSVPKTNHEISLSSATCGALGNSGINAECLGQWDFADPMKKSACTCSKCGSKNSKSGSSSGGNSSTSGSQSTKSGSTKARKSSYHKRNPQQLAALQKWDNLWDLPEDSSENLTTVDPTGSATKPGDSLMPNSSSANLRSMGMPGTPLGGPPSYKGPGSIIPVGLGSDGVLGASPMSVIPSPLPTPKSQPSSVHPHEGLLMSSPQPTNDKPSVTTPDAGAPKSVSSLSNQVFSPVVGTFDGAKGDSVEPSASAGHHVESQPRGPSGSATGVNVNPSEGANVGSYSKNSSRGLRRPILPSKEYEKQLEEEEKTQPSDIIYDYSQLEIWLNYPVKRMKSNDGRSKGTNYSWGFGMKTLPEHLNGSYERNYHGKRAADPYDFDDEHHQGSDGSKRRETGKDDGQSESNGAKKAPPSSLFTSEGIKASMMDLDQIFDNSDTSSDETFQAPTPPGSNKPAGSMEDIISSTIRHKNQFPSLRPEELSKMFPTPPSHEHNPILSPMGLQPETPSALETLIETSKRGQDNYSLTGSPVEELGELKSDSSSGYARSSGMQGHSRNQSQDWSYVYKPPSIYKMLGSSKYAPLHSLPSQQLPPIALPVSSMYTPSYLTSTSATSGQATCVTTARSAASVAIASNAIIHQSRVAHMRPGLSPRSPAAAGFRGPMSDLGSPTPNMYLTMRGNHPGSIPSQGSMPHGSQALSQTGHSTRGSEAHALVVNLSLSDSVVNLFRDHNFDSCTMCVCTCNFGKAVGNIRGSEMGLYIPDSSLNEDPIRCNCGFSASVNRRLAHGAGLFYEDEFEITTPALAQEALPPDEWYDRKKPSFLLLDPKYPNMSALLTDKDASLAASVIDHMPAFLLELVREQCLLNLGNATSRFSGEIVDPKSIEKAYNLLYYLDGSRAALTALEHGRTVMIEAKGMSRSSEDALPLKPKQSIMHQWPFLWGRGPKSSQDVMQVMRMLLPLLQEAVQLPSGANTVNGPLTWRQFNLLAIKGTDVRCEPQPIPSILVGSEKDFVALSPLAVRFWEKLSLEPYGYPRDVAYIVVSPDSDFVLSKVRTFFKELSTVYEACQLGRHSPIAKVLRDGILRVGKSAASKLSTEQVDEWFTKLPDVPTSAVLKLYAQVCRHYLAPQLATINLDHTLLEPSPSNRSPGQERPTPSPKMPPPSDPSMGPTQGPLTPKSEYDTDAPVKEMPTQESLEDDEREPPALVVYLIDPFGFAVDNKDTHRMANLGLLRCFASMLNLLPETVKNNITLQVVSLEDIMSLGNSLFDAKSKSDQLRHLSLTVYSQCRRFLVHQNTVKSLTGFGPAAAADLFLRTKDERRSASYRLYTPPFVLAPSKEKTSEGAEWMNSMPGYTIAGMVSSGNSQVGGPKLNPTSSSVLYVAYCISEDHRWLLASATDERGELLETTMISIYVPNRSKRRKASARKHGLHKLMDFILGLMSMGVHPWRLVVGRLGRVGHGELESWSSLLSKKNLIRASTQLREACRQCELQCQYDCPCVLSASLVSFEPDSCLRLMPDQFTPDERFSEGNSNLSTPQDISVTHVMAFPTSATTQSSQSTFHEQHLNPNIDDDDLLLTLGGDGDDMGVDDQITGGLDFTDIFNNWEDNTTGGQSPLGGSPRKDSASQPGSPGIGASGRQSPNFQQGSQGRMGGRGEPGEDFGTILQQPLALGYYVSTAPAGNLPKWFWASCPQRSVEESGAVFLKSALHLHSHSILQNSDDILQQQSLAKQHPLDSQLTADVLRFVLEGYNALSWLTFDPKTHDRQSCLPVHMQKLIQLYHTTGTLV